MVQAADLDGLFLDLFSPFDDGRARLTMPTAKEDRAMRTLTIVAALVLWAGEAGARELGTGNGLLALCESKELWENATCNGFVAGANSSYKMLKAAEANKSKTVSVKKARSIIFNHKEGDMKI
ncbi:MAG: hypothetical protein QGG19_22945 [Alphaproteobacteria bacterium]|nr:hypothetical protein [Alphaproteobacteria bacterium]